MKTKTVSSKMPENFYKFILSDMNDFHGNRYAGIFGSTALWLWERDVVGKEPSWRPTDLDVFVEPCQSAGITWEKVLDQLSVAWGGVQRPGRWRAIRSPARPIDVVFMDHCDAAQMTSPGTQVAVMYDNEHTTATFFYTETFERAVQAREWVEPNPILSGQGRGRYLPIDERWAPARVEKYKKRGYQVTFDSSKEPYCQVAEGVGSLKKRRRI
jgi:hypothetical protein